MLSICMYFRSICLLLLILQLANGQPYRSVGDKRITWNKIIVDKSGIGNFSTIQSAIDSVPLNNNHWVSIYVKSGTYREKVKIPRDKPFIILKGERKKETWVVWDDHYSIEQSPTFSSLADNIIVKSISFVNSYDSPANKRNPRVPAVAAWIGGDMSSFYRCGFFGLQDTLWDDRGRHYYYKCTIQGAVDFIFGSGQSIFERSSISVIAGALPPGVAGYITAQGRERPEDANGFVFKECRVYGNGSTYLGRAWRGYSRVVFYSSYFADIIVPQGWDPWSFLGQEQQLTYAEFGCYGPGSDTSGRVSWERQLSLEAVQQITSMRFIDAEAWIRKQPS